MEEENSSSINSKEREEDDEQTKNDEIDIDKTLEERAAQTNLSVQNVKSIIHHVLKDKRVVAMAKKIAEEDKTDDFVIFEPKLTRSRVRQAVASTVGEVNFSPNKQSGGVSNTPVKVPLITPVTRSLLDITFSEESSDDEYDPSKDKCKDSEDLESDIEEDEKEEHFYGSDTETEKEDESGIHSNISTPKISNKEEDVLKEQEQVSFSCVAPIQSTSTEHITTTCPSSSSTIIPSSIHVTSSTSPVSMTTNVSIPTLSTKDKTNEVSEEHIIQEAASLLASLSDTILSPLRPSRPLLAPPMHSAPSDPPTSNIMETNEETIGEIAHRTRSKFPLDDTDIADIEASFNPPDIPLDDTCSINTPNTTIDIDDDELEWQQWLADLMNPQSSTHFQEVEEQEDDTEYNFWADHHEDEKEEFRNDRGVKIPQREVDELIEELLNPDSGVFNTDITSLTTPTINLGTDTQRLNEEGGKEREGITGSLGSSGIDLTSVYLLESLGLNLPVLTHTHTSRSLTPNKTPVPAREYSGRLAETQRQEIEESSGEDDSFYLTRNQTLQLWDQIQQHFQLLLQNFLLTRFEPSLVFLSQIASQAIEELVKYCEEPNESSTGSVWYIPGLEEGKELIKKYNPHDSDAVELLTASTGQPPKIPDVVQDIIMSYGVFWQYPDLLPEIGFSPLEGSQGQVSKYFSNSEDCLLVLGMDHYGSSAWKIIQERLLPTKTPKQLQLRVKNLSSSRQKGDNPIKYYKRTGHIKIPFHCDNQTEDNTSEATSSDNTSTHSYKIHQWILTYHRKRSDKEKTEEMKKEKQMEEMHKFTKACQDLKSSTVAGSKRNLTGQMNAVESSAKKMKEMDESDLSLGEKGQGKSVRGRKSSRGTGKGRKKSSFPTSGTPKKSSSPHCDYTQLLFMAGLEASDPAARYAYNYLTEVKATVIDSPGVYDKFLKLIIKARKNRWRPVQLYNQISHLLKPWPYLTKLFMGFLQPFEAQEVNKISDKMEFEQVKSFITSLENKYSKAPLELEEILSKMRELEKEKLTKEKVLDNLTPLIEAHEDLVQDLKNFVEGKPFNLYATEPIINHSQDDFEEVVITHSKKSLTEVDEFEDVYMNDDWAPLECMDVSHDTNQTKHNETKTDSSIENRMEHSNENQGLQLGTSSSPYTTEVPPHETNTVRSSYDDSVQLTKSSITTENRLFENTDTCQVSTDSVSIAEISRDITTEQTNRITDTTEQSKSERAAVKTWTKDDDRIILQICTSNNDDVSNSFIKLADQLNRTEEEVRWRYQELLTLINSMNS